MIIISDEQKKNLMQKIPNLEELLKQGDVNELLLSIDDLIVDNILANSDEPDEEGIRLQRIYDQIYNQNG